MIDSVEDFSRLVCDVILIINRLDLWALGICNACVGDFSKPGWPQSIEFTLRSPHPSVRFVYLNGFVRLTIYQLSDQPE